ncbi:MAG: DEAD/DEAH box helicase [Candidatus Sulfobium sp.]
MTIKDFIERFRRDREFRAQTAGYRYVPPSPAVYAELDLPEEVRGALAREGISRFYSHQAKAIDSARKGENMVVMTPTASGKSLVYNIPVVESILADAGAKSLYVFPLKGLEQDQMRALNSLSSSIGIGNAGEVYDGDTTPYRRKKIREAPPNAVFTNPDMLHLALLPFHDKWADFFRHLRYVIVDEIHSYRGVFGSHAAQIFRRLRRICSYYGSSPRFITASATIANAGGLAEQLFGLPFTVVQESGAPSAGKHFFFVMPVNSPYTAATNFFVDCMKSDVRTIVFTKSRKITELIYKWTVESAPEIREKISPYRAGFLPAERREIERRLFSGKLLGVVSTSALELGVDIGGLDVCILCGYPGSVSGTWQRAGRAGRQGRESMIVLIAIEDALDQYFVRHHGECFEKSHEDAVIDSDPVYDTGKLTPLIDELVAERNLSRGREGDIWFSTDRRPHRNVGIRSIGERFTLVDEGGRSIGEVTGWRVFREAFPGAIYLHRGRQYRIIRLDIEGRKAVCTPVVSRYYTQPLTSGDTGIVKEKDKRALDKIAFSWGTLRITQRVTGYDRKRIHDRVTISTHDLDLPEHVFETEGLWTVIDAATQAAIESKGFDLGGTLHAVEHASIACVPLFALCDRGDIGGLSHTLFPQLGRPAIFVYDGHEGGVGLSRRLLDVAAEWLTAALKIIEECPCEGGCPSCVQDPQCGNRNEPLDKDGARFLLKRWIA